MTTKTVPLVPSWVAASRMFGAYIQSWMPADKASTTQEILTEIERMASLADKYVESVKDAEGSRDPFEHSADTHLGRRERFMAGDTAMYMRATFKRLIDSLCVMQIEVRSEEGVEQTFKRQEDVRYMVYDETMVNLILGWAFEIDGVVSFDITYEEVLSHDNRPEHHLWLVALYHWSNAPEEIWNDYTDDSHIEKAIAFADGVVLGMGD